MRVDFFTCQRACGLGAASSYFYRRRNEKSAKKSAAKRKAGTRQRVPVAQPRQRFGVQICRPRMFDTELRGGRSRSCDNGVNDDNRILGELHVS